MKSPFPILVGWAAGAAASAAGCLAVGFIADRLSPSPRFRIAELLPGILWWFAVVAIAMVPGVLIGALIFYFSNWLRDKHAWWRAGIYGVLVMWAWAIPYGVAHRIIEGWQVALFLGAGAFVSASVFWYFVLRMEKKAS